MNKYLEFLLLLLSQFAGGPGPKENNLVRFGLPAVLWAALLFIAWSRQRREKLPRERMLLLGFGLGLGREVFMFLHMMELIMVERATGTHEPAQCLSQPFEHALAMASILVVIASFLRYILDDEKLARRYLYVGLVATIVSYLFNFFWWPQYSALNPATKFHQAFGGIVLHVITSVLIIVAIGFMFRKRGWLRNVVSIALLFYLFGEAIVLVNAVTGTVYNYIMCPIANSFHILAIPVLGVVYFQEQSLEKRSADEQLEAYREHLEELVDARTAELTVANTQLQREIVDRKQAQDAFAQLSRRNELILNSAGEGIFGVDLEGRHTFANLAAAGMLGFDVAELIGRPSHTTWHHSKPDGSPYPEQECPLHTGYKTGRIQYGSDQVFWREDNTPFPVEYMSTPIIEEGTLKGAVVVFKDITERKRTEQEIARRNAELATQNIISATVSQSLELDTILDTALNAVSRILDMNVGCIFLLDAETEMLTPRIFRVGSALDTFHGTAADFSLEQMISERAIERMRPVVIEAADFAQQPSSIVVGELLEILVSIPLVAKGNPLGALTLGSPKADAVPAQSLELLTAIGQQIGVAIENARLYQQAEVAAALEERQRIAAEMHDGLAQVLSYLGHQVDKTTGFLEASQVSLALKVCQEIRETLDRATQDVRLSIASLREQPRPRRSLQDELADLIDALLATGGPPVKFVNTLTAPLYVPPKHLEQVLRVVNEALLNAQHHAQAQQIVVHLEQRALEGIIKVTDDGTGFNPTVPSMDGRDHFGLSIMHARASRIGGSVEITSTPDTGTCVMMRWPIKRG